MQNMKPIAQQLVAQLRRAELCCFFGKMGAVCGSTRQPHRERVPRFRSRND
jgi:hypothetical protein